MKCNLCEEQEVMLGNSMCENCWEVQKRMNIMSLKTIRRIVKFVKPHHLEHYLSVMESKASSLQQHMSHRSRQCGMITPTELGEYADELKDALAAVLDGGG